MLGPRSKMFYTSTFIDNNAGGLLPPTAASMGTLMNSMTEACYGEVFQPDRCSILSQMVARVRTQDANAVSIATGGRTAPGASGLAAFSTSDSSAPVVTPATLASALAVLGTTSGTSLAVC
jgi:hypothetical protein